MSLIYRYSPATETRKASVTVFLEGRPYPISGDTAQFDTIMSALKAGNDQAVIDAIQVKKAIVTYSNGQVQIVNGELTYNNVPINAAMNSRIMALVSEKINIDPIAKFIENVMQNPAEHARNELYLFLEACDLPITEDGHFLAYKVVRNDYKDKHTGTMDNSVGVTVKLDRSNCNSNRDQTCSSGLHFCSHSYIEHFRSGGDRLMVLKVNPRDVVSIPSDYNNAKGRACAYEIFSELTDEEKIVNNFAPASAPVAVKKDQVVAAPTVNVSAKLDENKVRQIRKLLKAGNKPSAVAKMFNVSDRQIGRIADGTAWKNVK